MASYAIGSKQLYEWLAKERGTHGFSANVLAGDRAMIKVFEKEGKIEDKMDQGIYKLIIRFDR